MDDADRTHFRLPDLTMPAVTYSGKAFTHNGKLYSSDVCPPCCDCVPGECCESTGKFQCLEAADYTYPVKIQGYLTIAGVPNTIITESFIEDPPSPDFGTCPCPKNDYHRMVTFSGMAALNGTYPIVALDSSGTECYPSSTPDYEACDVYGSTTCKWYALVPTVSVTANFYERRNQCTNAWDPGPTETITDIDYTGYCKMDGTQGIRANLSDAGGTEHIRLGIGSSDATDFGNARWTWGRTLWSSPSLSDTTARVLVYDALSSCNIVDLTEIVYQDASTGDGVESDSDSNTGCSRIVNYRYRETYAGYTVTRRAYT